MHNINRSDSVIYAYNIFKFYGDIRLKWKTVQYFQMILILMIKNYFYLYTIFIVIQSKSSINCHWISKIDLMMVALVFLFNL
jgi:hypothetical protein